MNLQAVCSVMYWLLAVRAQSIDSTESEYDNDYDEVPAIKIERPKKPSNKGTGNVVHSIVQFLSTTEKIWVYNSTEKSNKICSVDVMDDVTPFYANMTRYYISDGVIKNITAEALYDIHPIFATTADPYNEMQIQTSATREPYETLLYQSNDSECGVFFMNYHNDLSLPDGTWFELRLRNSSIEKGPHENCSLMWEYVTQYQTARYSYTPSCQCIFAQRSYVKRQG
uniref:Putative group i salivary lipocalin n=1 Tax=Rhipicephalus pulchellus TaxID=72859 RepID=L7LR04_RHIPC